MADQNQIEEILKRKQEAEEKLKTLQEASRNSMEETAKQQLEIDGINDELDNARNPNNPIFKIFSRAGEKAGNVLRNVRLSIMSEEDLKNEYQVYKRVNDTLGKESVAFDVFKETPEDFIEKNAKPTAFRKVEDSIRDSSASLNNTLQEAVKSSEKNLEKAAVIVENAVQRAAPKVSSFTSFLGKSFSELGKQVKDIVTTTIDEYKKAEEEVKQEDNATSTTDVIKENNKQEVKKDEVKKVEPVAKEKTVVESVVAEPTVPVKKSVTKKPASKPVVDKETLLARRKIFQNYKKAVDKATPKGVQPTYNFADYKQYVEGLDIAVDRKHQLNAVTFSKALTATIKAQEKKEATKITTETEIEPVKTVTKRKPS